MYIQEVILPTPSLFEENMMSALNSFVMFNKAEIINTIQVGVGLFLCIYVGDGERVSTYSAKSNSLYAVPFCYMHEIMMERFSRFLLGAF